MMAFVSLSNIDDSSTCTLDGANGHRPIWAENAGPSSSPPLLLTFPSSFPPLHHFDPLNEMETEENSEEINVVTRKSEKSKSETDDSKFRLQSHGNLSLQSSKESITKSDSSATFVEDETYDCKTPPNYVCSNSSRSDLTDSRITGSSESAKRAKKKSWYNAIYPNYKSRSDHFKKIFSSLSCDERLIAEYSCALQKDLLVHGRLYATKNYLYFYANFFSWETKLDIRWKDVKSLTKEKTALVIPNAIQVTTENEKFFFTSFTMRDKTYLMLSKLWQNDLLDQSASAMEIWQWVHSVYGDELGLTSDDEVDYVSPYRDDPDLSLNSSEKLYSSKNPSLTITPSSKGSQNKETGGSEASSETKSETHHHHNGETLRAKNLASDLSCEEEETSDSFIKEVLDIKKKKKGNSLSVPPSVSVSNNLESWRRSHEGRELTNEMFPIPVDGLFTLLFTNSKFFLDFHRSRKTFDIEFSPWNQKPENDDKVRQVCFTISLTHPMGPKHSRVTENQTMSYKSYPGYYYMIDVDIYNSGIPYADSFYVSVYFCLSRVSDHESRLTNIAEIKYKKSVWEFVKTIIDKNSWIGVEEFYSSLVQALHSEAEQDRPRGNKGRIRGVRNVTRVSSVRSSTNVSYHSKDLTRKAITTSNGLLNSSSSDQTLANDNFSFGISWNIKLIILLLTGLCITNVILLYKLSNLDFRLQNKSLEHDVELTPSSSDEWVQLLQKQSILHQNEIKKWSDMLELAVKVLQQSEKSLRNAQEIVYPDTSIFTHSHTEDKDTSLSEKLLPKIEL